MPDLLNNLTKYMDKISKETRSRNMSAIKGKNTTPEITVRKILYSMGYRYRLNVKDLPGKPDIVLKKHNKYSFLALPLTTASKTNKYRISVGIIDGKNAFANLSQIRNLDSKRLINKIGHLDMKIMRKIKEKTRRVNLD